MSKPFGYLLGALAVTFIVSLNYANGSARTAGAGSRQLLADASGADAKVVAAAGDAAHGKSLYAANCASCHGATGTEGGVGPSLKGEKSKKNQAATVAWIKNPTPPMPKLYPSPLSDKDVNDIAAFVQTF